jgi:hypothetical protein
MRCRRLKLDLHFGKAVPESTAFDFNRCTGSPPTSASAALAQGAGIPNKCALPHCGQNPASYDSDMVSPFQ